MKKPKKLIFAHIINVLTIALIVECFLCAFLAVRLFAERDCFTRVEEATIQANEMLNHAMDENEKKLTVFADILAANSSNPNELLQTYMENFCSTQYFSALCIHRADGSTVSYAEHPHDMIEIVDFKKEAEKLPYISEIYSMGNTADKKYIYQAVPIIRNGETVAILYGYISLATLPNFVTTTAYNGACKLYLVEGNTGDLLIDTWHEVPLGNFYSMTVQDVQDDYDIHSMQDDVKHGKSGFFAFQPLETEEWYYTYYMPTGINNWSIHLVIDEETAFASHNEVSRTVFVLAVCVIFLTVIHVSALLLQTANIKRRDNARLKKSKYMYEVQKALLNAHNNPDFVELALKTVANELQAETVMLLTFSGRMVSNTYYWPSKDKSQAMDMLGRNIRDDFPVLFDLLSENQSVLYDGNDPKVELSNTAKAIFQNFEVSSMMLVPIMDNAGVLKGALSAVNMAEKVRDCEMLECVIYDFFMAITNVENHAIIKNMGAMDYLTNIKNRNSYESEIDSYASMDCKSLWCVFIDANGLHEINNTQGHKAGDIMLCAVADAVKRVFGSKHTYRLGGDEFIAFACDSSEDEFMKKKKLITAELAVKGYYISIGFAGNDKDDTGKFDVEQMVLEAEAAMYQDKWEYYQKHDIPLDRGHFPDTGSLIGK